MWHKPCRTFHSTMINGRNDTGPVNISRPTQNGNHFQDDIFKCIFSSENILILIMISLKFVLKGPADNNPALVQIMAWCRPGDKPLSEPILLVYWRIHASLGLNELIKQGLECDSLPWSSDKIETSD